MRRQGIVTGLALACVMAVVPIVPVAGRSSPERLTVDEVRTHVRRHHLFSGLATWYGEEVHLGRACKSGQMYDPEAAKAAVDISEWEELACHTLYVVAARGWVRVSANDTGYLYEAGRFVKEEREGVLRWWPSDRQDPDSYPIVIDLTPAMMDRLTGGARDTTLVDVYLWR